MANTAIDAIFGCDEILFGEASPSGTMPDSMTKIGKVYEDSCSISQEESEKSELYEEGKSIPLIVQKKKKAPVLEFSLFIDDFEVLKRTLGGTLTTTGSGGDTTGWGMNSGEMPANKAIRLKTKQGGWIEMPNCDIDARLEGAMTSSGEALRVAVRVSPLDVSSGSAFRIVRAAAVGG